MRNILASEQQKILGGCRIVFSRVFPVDEANPHLHPLWQTAEQFGAVCTNQIDEQVTHVVANSLGTDKVFLIFSFMLFLLSNFCFLSFFIFSSSEDGVFGEVRNYVLDIQRGGMWVYVPKLFTF